MSTSIEAASTRTSHSMTWRWAGRVASPLVALGLYFLIPAELGPAGRWTCVLSVLMALLWITEAMPLAATALLPIVLFPVLGVLPLKETTAAYANDVIFLFMGGFILALGMEKWGLHRRIALRVLTFAGSTPRRLLGGFMAASGFLTLWISNTATTVMMLPIGVSLLKLVEQRAREEGGEAEVQRWAGFGPALMLGIAWASSLASLGTPIGTAPNLLLRGFVEKTYGREMPFGAWMLAAMPVAVLLVISGWAALSVLFLRDRALKVPGGAALVREEMARLGPMNRGEQVVLVVFTATALAWIFRGPVTDWLGPSLPFLEHVTDTTIAMTGALLLFAIPVDLRRGQSAMDWETAGTLPWGVLLLFGGGLALAAALQKNGVDLWLGQQLLLLGSLPPWMLVVGVIAVMVLLTEITSNTAVTATFLPVLGGVAGALDMDPLSLQVPAAFAASCGFMLPVATPPNAIVFGSGFVTMRQMVKGGLVMDLISIVLLSLFAFTTLHFLR